ncbi:MAG: hypothetical protein ACFB9M_07365 [Myxococcota bacterium]
MVCLTAMKQLLVMGFLFGLSGTANAQAPTPKEIATAHGENALSAFGAVKADLALDFGGKPRIRGTLWTSSDGGLTRIEHRSGKTVVFDGRTAWVAPAGKASKSDRFDALTWSYFLLAPFKLGDPGANFAQNGVLPWAGRESVPTGKLTFESGVGDAPDDWYVTYADSDTHVLNGLAYIVTFGPQKKTEAEKEPHAVVYTEVQDVQGVKLATQWRFHLWSAEKGVFGDPIGSARISDIELIDKAGPDLFRAPEGSREVVLPIDG